MSAKKDEFCVYCHTNISNGKRYVGITSRPPEKRWRRGIGYTHNSHFYAAISKYGWDGFLHEILHTGLTHDEACSLEKTYIKNWNLNDANYGYNMTSGGEGACGRVCSDETRKKLSRSHIGIGKNVSLSDAHRSKISQALIGVPHPHKGGVRKPLTAEQRKTLSEVHKKPVEMLNNDLSVIATFPSASDAAEFIGLKSYADINRCCNRKRRTAGGHMWRCAAE